MRRLLLILLGSILSATGGEWDGKVFCGYQGWFRCEGDGGGVGWRHYGGADGPAESGLGIDIWPDVSELEGPLYETSLKKADGSPARVFSSLSPGTVRTHFRWMKESGIDAAFLQRFGTETRDEGMRKTLDTVLANVRQASRAEGRQWALMYDASGLKPGGLAVIRTDFTRLTDEEKLESDRPNYLTHGGKPLVAIWGIGFNDRGTDFDEWEELVAWFHARGFSVMLGVPYYWRKLDRDAVANERLHEIMAKADAVSPWAVGRFGTAEDAAANAKDVVTKDLAWCRAKEIEFLPVVFPGFSWHNLMKGRGQEAKLDAIPRKGGRFLWSQATALHDAGCRAVYVAMFDEMDEGTAVFKFDPDPPAAVPLLSEPGIPRDRYLKTCGAIGELLRDERGPEFPFEETDNRK